MLKLQLYDSQNVSNRNSLIQDLYKITLSLVFLQMSQKRPINLAQEMDGAIVLSKNRIPHGENVKRVALSHWLKKLR